MRKGHARYYFLFSSFLVLTVTFLIPGPGLATLPIPDDSSDTPLFATADSPDFSKRIIHDSAGLFLDLVVDNNHHAALHFQSTDIVSVLSKIDALLSQLPQSIRAPPIT